MEELDAAKGPAIERAVQIAFDHLTVPHDPHNPNRSFKKPIFPIFFPFNNDLDRQLACLVGALDQESARFNCTRDGTGPQTNCTVVFLNQLFAYKYEHGNTSTYGFDEIQLREVTRTQPMATVLQTMQQMLSLRKSNDEFSQPFVTAITDTIHQVIIQYTKAPDGLRMTFFREFNALLGTLQEITGFETYFKGFHDCTAGQSNAKGAIEAWRTAVSNSAASFAENLQYTRVYMAMFAIYFPSQADAINKLMAYYATNPSKETLEEVVNKWFP